MMMMMMKVKAMICFIQGVAGALVKAVEMDSKEKGEEVDDLLIDVSLSEVTYDDHVDEELAKITFISSGFDGGGNESSNREDFEQTRMGGSKMMTGPNFLDKSDLQLVCKL